MKSQIILLSLLFTTLFSYAQENCTNGIDDDGDGLIDLNDGDCPCNALIQIPSLIPNPSFELYNFCPDGYSQVDYMQNWIQATDATSDYYNNNAACNYILYAMTTYGLTPFPNGTGIVGAYYITNWKEYVGTTLSATMTAGTNYQIQFNVAAMFMFGDSPYHIADLPPTYITIYGCANGTNLPVPTQDAPSLYDPTWKVLGQVLYDPAAQWSVQNITFTPTFNVNAIMIGAPEQLPVEYQDLYELATGGYPYFLYDNLLLNQSAIFNAPTITITGNFCSQNVLLHSAFASQPNVTYTYQWYNNGVAIAGATSDTYAVPSYSATSSYSLRIFDGTNCAISTSVTTQNIPPPPPPTVVSPVAYCQFDTATPLTATGNTLLWYTGATGGTGTSTAPIPSTAVSGTVTYYVTQSCAGLESSRAPIQVNVNTKIQPDFNIDTVICHESEVAELTNTSPNGIAGNWNPTAINNTQSQQYIFTPNTGVCAFTQIVNVNVIPPVEFHLEGGCNEGQYYLNAISDSGTFDMNTLHFAWTDSNGNAIGGDETSINITEIVNGTLEEEEFPLPFGLSITDANNCATYSEFMIEKVFCNIQKGISVNSDDRNDFFDLRGLHVNRLKIFNRLGMVVFSKDNYTVEWKGQSDKGNLLPSGTYYYDIQTESGESKYGWIYLQR